MLCILRNIFVYVTTLFIAVGLASTTASQVPYLINYQGQVEHKGVPVDGNVTMIFSIYDVPSGSTPLWSEEQLVMVYDGIYNVLLGSGTKLSGMDFGPELFSSPERWLEVRINSEVCQPRQQITSVAYALRSEQAYDADTLNGMSAWEFLHTDQGLMEGKADENAQILGVKNHGQGMGISAETEGNIAVRGLNHKTGPSYSYGGYFEAYTKQGKGVTGAVNGDNALGVYGTATGSNGVGVFGESTYGQGVKGESQNNDGVVGWTGDSAHSGVYGWSNVGAGVTGRSQGNNHGVFGATVSSSSNHAGVHGRNSGPAGSGPGVFGEGMNGNGVKGITHSSDQWVPSIYGRNEAAGDGVYGWSQNRYGAVGVTYSTSPFQAAVWAKNNGNGTGILAEAGSSGIAAVFKGNLQILSASSGAVLTEIGEGLDYAEGFDVAENLGINPGSVLVIDPDNPGKLTISRRPYDTKVAGIVAGANSLGSGVRLGAGQFDHDLALAGRVYCNVVAGLTAIEPGDMLTTSDIPGFAMKVIDLTRAQGAILGKAMQRLEKGRKGQILVLVTLQ